MVATPFCNSRLSQSRAWCSASTRQEEAWRGWAGFPCRLHRLTCSLSPALQHPLPQHGAALKGSDRHTEQCQDERMAHTCKGSPGTGIFPCCPAEFEPRALKEPLFQQDTVLLLLPAGKAKRAPERVGSVRW